ncbi:MAG: co-chaperone DjlA [Gammaproteobacteria bacterium]|nr:co-chaperone DjlA [Gammaproteobacteria bacterium]
MSWWGKVVGAGLGYMLGGVLGGLLGVALGYKIDQKLRSGSADSNERIQSAFFTATFSIMGHLAKADGRVSEREIEIAHHVMRQMRLSPEQTEAARGLFRQGKAEDFPLDQVLEQFRSECRRRITLLIMFMEIQVMTAMADGHLDKAEEKILHHIAHELGMSEAILAEMIQRLRAEQAYTRYEAYHDDKRALEAAYGVLAVPSSATNDEVKKSYRRLMSQHHPDKLVSKGLPEEMMEIAKQKTQEIKAAYDVIRKARESVS